MQTTEHAWHSDVALGDYRDGNNGSPWLSIQLFTV